MITFKLIEKKVRKFLFQPWCGQMIIKLMLTTLLALALINTAFSQMAYKVKLDQFFDRLLEKNQAMGSVIITSNSNVVYTRNIGFSRINGNEKKPLTASTRYRVGSITKMFTAVMVFQLIEERKLNPTDTLKKFFPQIPNADKITIQQLLGHRSGLHDFTEDRDFRGWKMNHKTKDEMVAIIAGGEPSFDPGQKTEYCNAGFVLLGYIIEKVSGQPYQQALKERITSKIGLKNTYLGSGYTDTTKNESFSYNYVGNWKQEPETDLSIPGGAGALISTPADLCIFIQALFDLKLVSRENLNQMTENKLGMETFMYNGKTAYGHTGGIDGFGSWLVYIPEEKLAVAYTSNGKVYPVASIITDVFDIYWNKPFSIPTFEPIAIKPDVLDKYVGVYSSTEAPVKFTVTRNGAILYLKNERGQSPVPLEATDQDKFKIERAGIVIEFDAMKNQMTLKRGGREKIFTKEK